MAIEVSMSVYRVWDKNYLIKLGENRPELLLFYGHRVTKTVTETCLSQWYPCQFEVDGVTYTSAEQYMMAEKARLFGDEEIRTEILSISDPRTCKALGRKVKNFDKAVWDKKTFPQGFMRLTVKEYKTLSEKAFKVNKSVPDYVTGLAKKDAQAR